MASAEVRVTSPAATFWNWRSPPTATELKPSPLDGTCRPKAVLELPSPSAMAKSLQASSKEVLPDAFDPLPFAGLPLLFPLAGDPEPIASL